MNLPAISQALTEKEIPEKRTQPCPVCGHRIGNIAGSKKAICKNCGFKDPCCE